MSGDEKMTYAEWQERARRKQCLDDGHDFEHAGDRWTGGLDKVFCARCRRSWMCAEEETPMSDRDNRPIAEWERLRELTNVIRRHQRMDSVSEYKCACGPIDPQWAHSEHLAARIEEAGLLATPPEDADVVRAARALHHHGACTCEDLAGCLDDVHVVVSALRGDAPACGGCPACDVGQVERVEPARARAHVRAMKE